MAIKKQFGKKGRWARNVWRWGACTRVSRPLKAELKKTTKRIREREEELARHADEQTNLESQRMQNPQVRKRVEELRITILYDKDAIRELQQTKTVLEQELERMRQKYYG